MGGFADLAGSVIIDRMTDWIEHFREAACGMPVSHVWRGHGSALFIELGALTPTTRRDGSSGNPMGEIGLMIEWSWRIEDARSIACGSWSDEVLWQPSFNRLFGREVIDLTTFGRLPEIMLSLSGDLYVASFMTAEGDPEWSLFDRRGPVPIAVGCRSGAITNEA
ncbi:hypothetical protein [Methylobacterium bullatum]|uniref:hypothetical protein n=1 Tax=Methylobacterium bullatum TaxID=570505 RepID=UPI0030CDB69F